MTGGLRPHRRPQPPRAAAGDNSDKAHPFRRARALRYSQTWSEYQLWRKQIRGQRFRRQHPIGPYFADFVCIALRLVIEVDGMTHLDAAQIEHDIARTRWLRREGYHVLRFWNLDVLTNIDRVVERIDREVQVRLRLKFPPPTKLEGAERSEGEELSAQALSSLAMETVRGGRTGAALPRKLLPHASGVPPPAFGRRGK